MVTDPVIVLLSPGFPQTLLTVLSSTQLMDHSVICSEHGNIQFDQDTLVVSIAAEYYRSLHPWHMAYLVIHIIIRCESHQIQEQ